MPRNTKSNQQRTTRARVPRPGRSRPTFRGRRRRPTSTTPDSESLLPGVRLQKVMATAGIGSRRKCEELIEQGRVEVDGQIVMELGIRVDLEKQDVRVDGESLRPRRPVYYLLNKPVGVVCTNHDQEGRQRVIDLVPPQKHLFSVGRLDRNSEGLILITNDGALANRLAHPRYGVEKLYRVIVAGHPTQADIQQLLQGVHLAEGFVKATGIRIKQLQKKNAVLEILLTEGRNREIRRMLARCGHKVLELKRVQMGTLRLGDLPTGAFRELTRAEVRQLAEGKPRRRHTPRGAALSDSNYAKGRRTAKRPTGFQSQGQRGPRPQDSSGSQAADRPRRKGAGRPGTGGRRVSDSKASGGIAHGGKASGGKFSGGKTTGRKVSGRKVSGRKASGGKTTGRKVSEGKASEGKTTGRKVSGRRTGGSLESWSRSTSGKPKRGKSSQGAPGRTGKQGKRSSDASASERSGQKSKRPAAGKSGQGTRVKQAGGAKSTAKARRKVSQRKPNGGQGTPAFEPAIVRGGTGTRTPSGRQAGRQAGRQGARPGKSGGKFRGKGRSSASGRNRH